MIRRTRAYTLRNALDSYLETHTLSDGAQRKLTASVQSFARFCGDDHLNQITPELLNAWIAEEEAAFKPATVIGHRASVLTILRRAADDGWRNEPVSRKIRRPRKPKPLPTAWTIEELRRVQVTCDNLPGELKRFGTCVPVCVYFGCFVRISYETGLRRGNIFSLRQTNISDNGTCYVKHEKTGQPHVCEISQTALALFRQLPGEFPPEMAKLLEVLPQMETDLQSRESATRWPAANSQDSGNASVARAARQPVASATIPRTSDG